MNNKYICECGKEFDNSQSFNGHKSHCKVHQLKKRGSEKAVKEFFITTNNSISAKVSSFQKEYHANKRQHDIDQ